MQAVTIENPFTQVWNNIYEVISTIPDPNANRPENFKWIASVFPEIDHSQKAYAFPFIVINPVEITHDILTVGGKYMVECLVDIDIYSTKAAELDSLSDAVVKAMRDYRKSFRENNLYNMEIENVTNSIVEIPNIHGRVKVRTLTYSFNYVG